MASTFDIALVIFAILSSGYIAYLWLDNAETADKADPRGEPELSYLFDHGVLQHASGTTAQFCPLEAGFHEWSDLHHNVSGRFAMFPDKPPSTPEGQLIVPATDPKIHTLIRITWEKHLCRVVVLDPNDMGVDLRSEAEVTLTRLRSTVSVPLWHTDHANRLLWYNDAYHELFNACHPGQAIETQRLFPSDFSNATHRLSLRDRTTGVKDWYAVTHSQSRSINCYQATCITTLVRAEEAQRNFVQTLTKTFAQLSIGLAIFDRKSQLVLFNPALIDLTGLGAQFLSARPAIQTFFDKLREARKIPEPKDYATWRTTVSELISAAYDGRYEEIWSLESGQTFRVKGRPHPDGATAFLIEDISAQVSLTRTFRAELEQGQAMLDTLDDAIVVFSSSGILTFSNTAYNHLWGVDPDMTFADISIHDAIQGWHRRSAPNLLWQEIEDFVTNREDRMKWSMPLYLANGTELTCLFSPIVDGATLIRFHQPKKPVAEIENPEAEKPPQDA